MKIGQVVCVFPPYKGGIGNCAFSFWEKMAANGFEIENLTPAYQKQIIADDKKLQVIRLKPWLKYGNAALIPQLLRKLKKYDIIYLHYPFFGGAEIVYLFKIFNPKKKLIIHYHMDAVLSGFLQKIFSLPNALIKNLLFKKAEAVVCASLDYVQNSSIKNIYKKNTEKFFEIPFSVNLNKFKPDDFKKEGAKINLLFVGSLDKAHYFKGLNVLLKALSELKNKNWEISVVGDGNMRKDYEKKTKQLLLEKNVKFCGKLNEEKLIKKYQEADIFILPSINKSEAFGIVLLEALSSGLPVIATNLPGVRKVFQDGVQGFLCQPNNTESLKDKIKKLINDYSLRSEMSEKARAWAEKKYSQEREKKQLFDVLKK